MDNRLLRVGATALSLLLVSSAALAGPGPGGREGRRPGRAVKAALAKLDLTQDQKDRLRALAESARPGLQALREQRRADRSALRAALEAPKPDPAAVGNLMLKMKLGRETARTERQRFHEATLGILTPEQRVRFETYLDAFKMMRQRGRGPQP